MEFPLGRNFLEVALADHPRGRWRIGGWPLGGRRLAGARRYGGADGRWGEDGLLALAATGGIFGCSPESGRVIGCVEGTAVLNRSQASSYLQKIRVNGASLRITCPGD